MATGTILDMFMPPTAETVGTPRVDRIANEPYEQQIRQSGMSVLDAMLSAARDKVVEIASGTSIGQDLLASAQQQQQASFFQKWGTLLIVGGVALIFVLGMAIGKR